MTGPHEGASPKLDAGERIPPRPDTGPPSSMLTVAVLGLAILATVLIVPAFVQSFSWSGTPEGPGPSGLPAGLWTISFLIGAPSLLLALMGRHRERQRDSRAGLRLAGLAVGVAVLGSCFGGWCLLVGASAGL